MTIDEKIEKLLECDLRNNDENHFQFTDEMKGLIHEIGGELRERNVELLERFDIPDWIEKASPEEIYTHMLMKIIDSPTKIHMKCCVWKYCPYREEKRDGRREGC